VLRRHRGVAPTYFFMNKFRKLGFIEYNVNCGSIVRCWVWFCTTERLCDCQNTDPGTPRCQGFLFMQPLTAR
jgi:hypothetical protein